MSVKQYKDFEEIYKIGGSICTRNLVPGYRSHGEKILKISGEEYRVWDPHHSKPLAAIMNGLKSFPIRNGSRVLYLGVANGATASYFSDIVSNNGVIYGVDFSPRSMRDLLALCNHRKNIVPVLADANKPGECAPRVEACEIVYQDVAQRNQTDIFIRNMEWFLRENGCGLLMIKARSINVTAKPSEIYAQEKERLENSGLNVIEEVKLEPYERDHTCFVCER